MRIIGILGGVASGKSAVAEAFRRLGAGVLDADRAGHEALRLPAVEAAARRRWGATVFGPDERIDRAALARVVFSPGPEGRAERNYLERLTHPEIARLLWRQAEELTASGVGIAVLDAPLLLETDCDDFRKKCDKVVFVEAPPELRRARALARGWKESDFTAREDAQETLERKRTAADAIIDNSGPPERVQAQVERFLASLLR
jgi:dephospho-CoA kinase